MFYNSTLVYTGGKLNLNDTFLWRSCFEAFGIQHKKNEHEIWTAYGVIFQKYGTYVTLMTSSTQLSFSKKFWWTLTSVGGQVNEKR